MRAPAIIALALLALAGSACVSAARVPSVAALQGRAGEEAHVRALVRRAATAAAARAGNTT
jgi:hypothetical protein